MLEPNWDDTFFPPTRLNNQLPAIFAPGRITNSYKFFWFLAILDRVQHKDDFEIEVRDLIDDMVIQVWYPVNFSRLSLGKLDKLANAVKLVKNASGLAEKASQDEIREAIQEFRGQKELKAQLGDLARYLPFRMLSPWFSSKLSGIKDHQKNSIILNLAAAASRNRDEAPIYRFTGDQNEKIRINHHWFWYLRDHAEILRRFTLHHLGLYLQRRNPNVANIHAKIYPPRSRHLAPARKAWTAYLDRHPKTTCLFSGGPLHDVSIDHFLPWSFVAHDHAWNLLPIPKRVNSSKGNLLPHSTMVPAFASLQHHFLSDLHQHQKRSTLLEDYAHFFNANPHELVALPTPLFIQEMQQLLAPQLLVATNMGFLPM